MNRSSKEKAVMYTTNRLLNNDVQESVQMFTPFQEVEFSAEFQQPRDALRLHAAKRYR